MRMTIRTQIINTDESNNDNDNDNVEKDSCMVSSMDYDDTRERLGHTEWPC